MTLERRTELKRTPLARGDSELARTGPPERRTRLKVESDKAKANRPARAATRAAAGERDGGCVLHAMLRSRDPRGLHLCSGFTERRPGMETHEVLTRGRGGSALELANVVTLCPAAHDWCTNSTCAAECLGLVLTGAAVYADVFGIQAHRRRQQLLAGDLMAVPLPPWRELDPRFQTAAHRDLTRQGWNTTWTPESPEAPA